MPPRRRAAAVPNETRPANADEIAAIVAGLPSVITVPISMDTLINSTPQVNQVFNSVLDALRFRYQNQRLTCDLEIQPERSSYLRREIARQEERARYR